MIQKVILAATLCLSITACSDSKSGNTSPTENTLQGEDVTNTSLCRGRTPVETNLYSDKWVAKTRVSNGVELTQIFDFNHGRAVVTLSARYKDQFKKLRVYTDIEERAGNIIELGKSEELSETIMVENKPFRFSAVVSNITANYKFSGPCLVLSDRGHSKTFAPSRR